MKKLILILIGFAVTISTFAQVNGTLSYQGYLTGEDGQPVNDEESHSFVFKFYNEEGTEVLSRTIETEVDKGLFSVVIGGGSGDNSLLPTDIWDEDYTIGITVDGGTELTPRTPLTTVPYSFQAETANNVAGSNISGSIDATQLSGTIANGRLDAELQDLADGELSGSLIGTGISASNVTTGSLPNTVLDDDLQDLADGELSGSKIGSGIDGANIDDGSIPTDKISGTIAIADGGTNATTEDDARTNLGLVIGTNIQAYDADLADLADGELSGSLIGTGIDASHISTGLLPNGRLDTELQDLADGELTGSLIGTGIDADHITTGSIANTLLDADLQDLTDGSLTGSKVDPDFGAQHITTTEGLHVGGTSNPGTDNLIVDGSIGIGTTTTPTGSLQIIHGTDEPDTGAEGLAITSGANTWHLWTSSGFGPLSLYYNTTYKGSFDDSDGTYTEVSDIKAKKNIESLPNVLDQVNSVSVRKYHYKTQDDIDAKKIGVIAQELKPIFPELVKYSETEDMYSVNYSGFGPIAIKAIQEQQKIIDSLKLSLENMQNELNKVVKHDEEMKIQLSEQGKKIEKLFELMDQHPNNETVLLNVRKN